ncbi:hypothetical protein COT52_02210 [candidate division WWE3 bacterium CG08_land_8_20_14_0_20_43_13]|uniref:Glycosyltransferase subfamily 4-like N-terminal domain-containing protein n=1 Tax=candidate division WWE3 bacterium CG08_land_8_20_14_0_20_43_13 TaxID=1975087 RepID=A0A2H0X733_UNCKA|nr:MAG: hypothetical protein COT52_02210 [candidate division WWE3 bacterium CG08_land_8_20_14_0_20_43_13]
MKILIIQPWISYRGSEKISVDLACRLSRKGHQAVVAAVFVDYCRLPPRGNEVTYLAAPWWLAHWLKQSRLAWFVLGIPVLFCLVLFHARSFEFLNPHNLPSHWVAWAVGKCCRIPVVWTCHNLPQKPAFGKLGSFVWDTVVGTLDRAFIPRFDLILTFSRKTAAQLVYFGARVVKVHSPAVDWSFYQDISSNFGSLDLPQKKGLTLAVIANLHPVKNHRLVFKSLRILLDQGWELSLWLIGDGSYRQRLIYDCLRLGLAKNVYFFGYREAEEIKRIIKEVDLHICPSFVSEGCSLTPLECLCQNIPSIVIKNSGVDEYWRHWFPRLIAYPTVNDLSRKIVWAARHYQQIKSRSAECSIELKKRFDWDVYTDWFVRELTRFNI